MKDSSAPISVIVPCRDAERTLGEAIESVFAQTVLPIEVLVIDDRSSDRSVAIARSFGSRVRVLPNAGRGPGAARCLGVREAEGTYIVFVDADDLLVADKHERQLEVLEQRDPYTLVHTGTQRFYDDASRTAHPRPSAELASGRCTQVVFERNPVCGASIMLRRSVILELGNYDPQLYSAEDYGLLLAASTRCEFVYVPQSLYRARRHADNITNGRNQSAYYHWLAQDKFRVRFPEAFAQLPPESIEHHMVEPVRRAVQEAYWRRQAVGYRRLLRLAIALAPGDPQLRALWRRRWWPMAALRAWDRVGPRAATSHGTRTRAERCEKGFSHQRQAESRRDAAAAGSREGIPA